MIKQKLQEKRHAKKISQEDIAFKLGMETSSYNRRENGITKITKSEWIKLAKILECSLEDIYEPEDGIYVINNENASGNYSGSVNNFNQDKMVIDTLNRYILKLEKENEVISAKNNQLEQENERLRGK